MPRLKQPDLPLYSEHGRLKVVGEPFRKKIGAGHLVWFVHCECACGTKKDFNCAAILSGRTSSCRCLANEMTTTRNAIIKSKPNGGPSAERLRSVWRGMMMRCYDDGHPYFHYYGGRGIYVCEEWKEYAGFRAWALSCPEYSPTLTLERKKNDLGYSPDNCTWIPQAAQALNRRNNLRFEYAGECKLFQEWFKDPRCLAPSLLSMYTRLYAGWTFEKILTTPSKSPEKSRIAKEKRNKNV